MFRRRSGRLGVETMRSHFDDGSVNGSPLPPDVGASFREARERLGLTLEAASSATRISAEYLGALEGGAPLDAFPGPAYARMFARTYARLLRLDEGRLLEAFDAAQPADGAAGATRIPLLAEPARRRPPGLRTPDEPVGIHPDILTAAARPALPFSTAALRDAARARRRKGGRAIARVPVDLRSDAGSATLRRRRRARLLAVAAASTVAVVLGAVVAFPVRSALNKVSPSIVAGRATPPHPLPLPRGGYRIFPAFRVVAFYGAPRTEALGVLGEGPERAVPQLLSQAEAYGADGTPVLPAMELIATVASNRPGPDGMYRNRESPSIIDGYLAAAREARMLLVLDVQPGRADFFDEVKVYQRYLELPDVGLAIDPEWHVGPGQVPAKAIGSTDAKTVNRISAWLSGLVRARNLPQKLFVIHQFTVDMLRRKRDIVARPELATVLDVDGYGSRANKISKYAAFTRGYRTRFLQGIKLYYRQDPDLMGPAAVLKLRPTPDYIVYQ